MRRSELEDRRSRSKEQEGGDTSLGKGRARKGRKTFDEARAVVIGADKPDSAVKASRARKGPLCMRARNMNGEKEGRKG